MTGKLRVCVLQCSTEGSSGPLSDVDPDRKPEVYDTAAEFEWTNVFIRKDTSAAQLMELAVSGKYDVFMNLCDGAWDEDRAGIEVVEALERLNVPYTGADASFYEPSKVDIKMAVQPYGVAVPAWVLINRLGPTGQEGVEKGLAEVLAPPEHGGLRFPLIVKHPSGYSSVGMTKQSKVANEGELRQQVGLVMQQFGGALVEEFIAGREFTVLVVEEPTQAPEPPAAAAIRTTTDTDGGAAADTSAPAPAANGSGGEAAAAAPPAAVVGCDAAAVDADVGPLRVVAYAPVECVFGPGEDFKHFQLKWHDYETCSWRPCEEPRLAEQLKDATRKTFVATRGVSYGRCDFRVDAAGEVYLLEINANCGMLYPPGLHGSGDYILTLDPHRDHVHFLRTILTTALQRHRTKQLQHLATRLGRGDGEGHSAR